MEKSKFSKQLLALSASIRALTEISRERVKRVTGITTSTGIQGIRVIINVITAVVAHYDGSEIYKRFMVSSSLFSAAVSYLLKVTLWREKNDEEES